MSGYLIGLAVWWGASFLLGAVFVALARRYDRQQERNRPRCVVIELRPHERRRAG